MALPLEFEINIAEDSTVTAEDEDGNKIDVVNGVIQICVVNANKKSGTKATGAKDKGSKATEAAIDIGSENGSSISGNASTGDSAGKNSVPAASSGKKRVKARETYYKDGVRDLSMTFDEVVEP